MAALIKNQLVEAEITAYGSDGAGIARIDGQVVFVPGAARGDVCRLGITKVLKNRAYARIDAILTPSEHRRENDCPAFPQCGGCDFRHITYAEELALKGARIRDAMTRLGGLDPGEVAMTPAESIDSYRNKAQFPIGLSAEGRPVFGLYRRRSHQLRPIESCAIQDPRAAALVGAVCRWAEESGTAVYDEQAHTGPLRHVQVRTGTEGSHLCIVLRSGKVRWPDRLVELCRAADPGLQGISVSLNPERTNVVLGPTAAALWGAERLSETLMGHTFEISPHAFFQVNRPMAHRLYEGILDRAGAGALALDLYCGIGTITLALSGRFERVMGVEIVPQAIEDARLSAARNGISNADFLCADATQAAEKLALDGLRPELVVCDPPRKGMDEAGLSAITRMAPERIIYAACDPASLARDTAALRPLGYRVEALRGYDMFPRTANVEGLCLLVREG